MLECYLPWTPGFSEVHELLSSAVDDSTGASRQAGHFQRSPGQVVNARHSSYIHYTIAIISK